MDVEIHATSLVGFFVIVWFTVMALVIYAAARF